MGRQNWVIVIATISVVLLFFIVSKPDVITVTVSDGRSYLVRNLPDRDLAATRLSQIQDRIALFVKSLETAREDKKLSAEDIEEYGKYIDLLRDNLASGINLSESTAESGFTSYTVRKGERIVFCLRSAETGQLDDINTIIFVALHELAHIACPKTDFDPDEEHTPLFKRIFVFFLKHAIETGFWQYQDYAKDPVRYCGMTIDKVPL
jgi:hypothetical protein